MHTENPITANQFLDVIDHLRSGEEVLIHVGSYHQGEAFDEDVILYLEREYDNERKNYPADPPAFEAAAALWAARIVYTASHLLLDRSALPEDIPALLPGFSADITASAFVSADLCLRFLPAITTQAKNIDPDDSLIKLLEDILQSWHYSAIGYFTEIGNLDFEMITSDRCLAQLYTDRIIERKAEVFVSHGLLADRIKGSLGAYQDQFWPQL